MARITKAMLEATVNRQRGFIEELRNQFKFLEQENKLLRELSTATQVNTALCTVQELARAATNLVQSLPTVARMNEKGASEERR